MRDTFQPRTTREAILDATDRLLARNGYKKMTIDDLAREVGIGKGSIYLHFKSKEEIALSHIDRIIERIKVELETISMKKSRPETRLHEMLIARVLIRFDSVNHYSQSLNELLAHVRQPLLERRKRYFDEEARILATVIDEGQRSEVFRNGSSFVLASTLVTATNSMLPYSLSAVELGERDDVEKRTSDLADMLIRGLKKN